MKKNTVKNKNPPQTEGDFALSSVAGRELWANRNVSGLEASNNYSVAGRELWANRNPL